MALLFSQRKKAWKFSEKVQLFYATELSNAALPQTSNSMFFLGNIYKLKSIRWFLLFSVVSDIYLSEAVQIYCQ